MMMQTEIRFMQVHDPTLGFLDYEKCWVSVQFHHQNFPITSLPYKRINNYSQQHVLCSLFANPHHTIECALSKINDIETQLFALKRAFTRSQSRGSRCLRKFFIFLFSLDIEWGVLGCRAPLRCVRGSSEFTANFEGFCCHSNGENAHLHGNSAFPRNAKCAY